MNDELYDIIEYLKKIKNLKQWDLIMVWNDIHEYIDYYMDNWEIYLRLYDLSLCDYKDDLEKSECEYRLRFYERDIKFYWEHFDVEKWKLLLEKIIEEYKK